MECHYFKIPLLTTKISSNSIVRTANIAISPNAKCVIKTVFALNAKVFNSKS